MTDTRLIEDYLPSHEFVARLALQSRPLDRGMAHGGAGCAKMRV